MSADTDTERTSRPSVNVTDDLHVVVDRAWSALVKANDPTFPRVLVRGTELVRLTERGELESYDAHSLSEELSRAAEFFKPVISHGEMVGMSSVQVPERVARTLLARDPKDLPGAPRVDRVVDVPVLAADGSLVTEPGYHVGSRLLYVPAPGLAEVRPGPVDSIEDVVRARDYLMTDVLGEFPWADEASKANALGLLLLPFVRDFIDGPTPLHMISAHEPGTGKSLLADVLMAAGVGEIQDEPDTDSEEEYRKKITANLIRGDRAIKFDNVKRSLGAPALAAVLTARTWRDRILGQSKVAVIPVNPVWIATGNNTELTREMARRTVPIFLDKAQAPKRYSNPRIRRWAIEQRAEIASAALTLIRHWIQGEAVVDAAGVFERAPDGRLVMGEVLVDSYEEWAPVISGILEAADVPGFMTNHRQLMDEVDVQSRDASAFLAAWHALNLGPISSADLAAQAVIGQPLFAHLPDELLDLAQTEAKLRKQLSYWLRKHKGSTIGGYRLRATDPVGRALLWFVEPTS
jgi:hypothetical protein